MELLPAIAVNGAIYETWSVIVLVAITGLVGGVLGGMLGVGGSVIMIPALVLLFGQGERPGMNQHLYQAAAMIANVAVAVPAALRHHRAGAIHRRAIVWMMPCALLFVLAGVWMSNLWFFQGKQGAIWLGRVLGIFLVYIIIVNILRLRSHHATLEHRTPHVTPARSGAIGAMMGAIAGLMGIGGGVISVALQQTLMHMPLRSAIANSSAIICVSAIVGSIYKNATLTQHHLAWQDSVLLALLLAPTCMIGGHLGAILTHRLPIRQVRIAFIALLLVATWKMLAIPW